MDTTEKMLAKYVDISWGVRGCTLLPKSLREAWAGETLPEWISKELGLPVGSTAAALDESVWAVSGAEKLADRQRNFLLNLVQARRSEIQSVKVFSQPVPYWLDLKELPFSTRTRNCLVNANLLGENEQLTNITYRRLFDVRSMGVVSILEFVCLLETTVARASGLNQQPHAFSENELLEIISESWIGQVGPADPRFADLIPPGPHVTIFEMLDNLTSGPGDDTHALELLAEGMPELQRRLKQIEGLPLEAQLEDFLRALSRFEGERLRALIDRFGWSGSPAITLEEAGTRLGITRERLRQLQEKVLDRLKAISFPPYLPALDKAMRVLAEAGPLNMDAAASLLKSTGVSAVQFHPECVIAAANTCGRTPSIWLQTVGKKTIVAATAIPNANEILQVAYRQAHASGASNIAEVVAELQSLGVEADQNAVRHALREFSEVEFLEQDWFCHRPENPERDRLRNVTRKILSVASPIELGVIREGVRREYQYRKHRGVKSWSLLVPPRSVLRGYYQAHPEFHIDGNDLVKPVDPLDYRVELALNDTILVDVLRSSPASVLDRASFAAECERRSMNMSTFSIYLTYSPTIVHLGTDIWSLRGVRVDPAAVEAVRVANALRQREKRVLDHGWTAEGQLWVATRIPGAHVASTTVGIPGAIKHYLAGRQFKAMDDDGVSHGTIRINDEGASYGFGPFLRQRGADEGDILIAEFDLGGNAALLRLGDDELLDEMSPEA
jgi:hypothetical protein